jgi:hypothetical protein
MWFPKGNKLTSWSRNMAATILSFTSRSEQLRLRGMRNWGRFLTRRGRYSSPDAEERAVLENEQAEEARRDREWVERHGPQHGGAIVFSIFIEAPCSDSGSTPEYVHGEKRESKESKT